MKKYFKYLYMMLVVIAACYVCTVCIPTLKLKERIEICDEIGQSQEYLDVKAGMVLRQPFIMKYNEIAVLKVCLDSFLMNKQRGSLIAAVLDESGNILYEKNISGARLKDYGWQEIISDLTLEKNEIYYLELTNESYEEGDIRFVTNDKGRVCMQTVYRNPIKADDYLAYYWLVILIAMVWLTRIVRKYD